MEDENLKTIEMICHNCSEKYVSHKRGCPKCGSVKIRPKWIIDKRDVSRNFEVRLNRKFSEDDKESEEKIIQISKSWYNFEDGRLMYDKVNINTPEQWTKIQDAVNEFSGVAGWKSLDTQIQQLKGKNVEEIDKEFKEIISQHPEFTKRFLEAADIKNIEENDYPYYIQFIKIFTEKIKNAEDRAKIAMLNIFSRLPQESVKGIDELTDLMKSWSLMQITALSSILKTRLDSIDILEKAIHNERTYEIKGNDSIHSILEKSMWLIDETYWIALSNKSMKEFIIDELAKGAKQYEKVRPDFACVTFENKLIIVEIKRPSISIGKKELDQIEKYLMIADKYRSDEFRVCEGVLIGNIISNEARLLMRRRTGIHLMTYQDLINKTRFKYKDFLDALEKNK